MMGQGGGPKGDGTNLFLYSEDNEGVPLKSLNYFMAVITVVLSLLLIRATYRASDGYERVNSATENYIAWEQSASGIRDATDYLTEQARSFVMTGEKRYIENYFNEVNVQRRRETAMEELRGTGSPESYAMLEDAIARSREQMTIEYYAMRLTISAYGYDLSDFPEEMRATSLHISDMGLSRAEKQERARQLVLDSGYLEKKAAIAGDVRDYLTILEEETEARQVATAADLRQLLETQRLLIVFLIVIFAVIILTNSLLVIDPLTRSVGRIRGEQPLPVSGSYEFRFLARTYNRMFDTHRKKTMELAYEASHDKLTGLYNRVGYENLLASADLATSALLLIDADKFKDVNDTYGHDMGDRVLARIAHVLRDSFRSVDHVCRIGGDEFAAIMIHTGPRFTDLIRGKIEHVNERLQRPEDDLPPVSVSVGVAFGSAAHENPEDIVKDADKALYRVKENGRCGVAFYTPEDAEE